MYSHQIAPGTRLGSPFREPTSATTVLHGSRAGSNEAAHHRHGLSPARPSPTGTGTRSATTRYSPSAGGGQPHPYYLGNGGTGGGTTTSPSPNRRADPVPRASTQPLPQEHYTQRERLLADKCSFLQDELRYANMSIDRLERENVERLREVARIRREYEQRRMEEVGILNDEIAALRKELCQLQHSQSQQRSSPTQGNSPHSILSPPQPQQSRNTAPVTVAGQTSGSGAPAAAAKPKKPKQMAKMAGVAPSAATDKGFAPSQVKPSEVEAPIPAKERRLGDAEAPSSGDYKGSGPQAPPGANSIPLFDDGLAYRVENADDGSGDASWSFYNDTTRYQLYVDWEFGPSSQLNFGDQVQARRNDEGWYVVSTVVNPDQTQPFISGSINGWKASYSLKPLSDEYKAQLARESEGKVRGELQEMQQVFSEVGGNLHDARSVAASRGLPYVDVQFPPLHDSVSRPGTDPEMGIVPWKRPVDYLPAEKHGEICLFNGIDPNDIDQGELGDCWFLCAIASVAEFPKLIQKLFPERQRSNRGASDNYVVRLNKHGWWQDVIVDSYLPVKGRRPCFAATTENPAELWASLLEKAYAKLHGSYASISGGYPLHALMDLTGFAGWNITPRMEKSREGDAEASASLFSDLCDWDSKGYLISVGTPGVDESAYNVGRTGATDNSMKRKYEETGLVNGHAYSVLKVKDFPQYGFRLMQIRNPWGNSKEWCGEWGDADPRWEKYPDVAQECEFSQAADGTFWMPWSCFLEFFEDGQVCHNSQGYVDCRVKGVFQNGVPTSVLKVTVGGDQAVEAMCSLSQPDPRALDKDDPSTKKAAMLLTVALPKGRGNGRLDNNLCTGTDPFKSSDSRTYRYDRDQSIHLHLNPTGASSYLLPRIYDDAVSKEYVLSVRVPQSAIRSGGLSIEVVQFGPGAAPFENYATFSEEECNMQPTAAPMQVVTGDQMIEVRSGDSFAPLIQQLGFPQPQLQQQQRYRPQQQQQQQQDQYQYHQQQQHYYEEDAGVDDAASSSSSFNPIGGMMNAVQGFFS